VKPWVACAASLARTRRRSRRLRWSQLDLLVDASPSGTVADGTVERLTQRWHERLSGEAAAATAASNAVLAKFAAEAAAQRCVLRRP
jgi:hypothetical protein